MKRIWLIYLLHTGILASSGRVLVAQHFSTRLYTTADGLSDNYILSIYQDSFGYLWIGTYNGLNRFDGKNFVSYGMGHGLPSMSVDRIYEDRRHRLWIGTRAGMAELKGDSCYTYPVEDNQSITFVSGFLEPDSSTLWASTNKGLYELANNRWKKINLVPGYEQAAISKIIKAGGFLFINYDNHKLVRLRAGGKADLLLSDTSRYPYYHSLFVLHDSIYIGTYSGLFYRQQDTWSPLFRDTLRKKHIYTSYPDKKNRWWFGTKQDGVLVAEQEGGKTIFTSLPLSFNLVSNFFECRDGNMWVAGFQGLLKVTSAGYAMVSIPELDKMRFIRNTIALPSGQVLVSGDNGRLLILRENPLPEQAARPEVVLNLDDKTDFIDHYTFDEKQRLWFTTRNSRLYRLDGHTLKNFSSIIACPNNFLRDLAYNRKTRQLFVCGDSVLLSGNENRLDTFFSHDKTFIPLPAVIHLREDNGSMLVQTLENGLYHVNPEKKLTILDKEYDFRFSVTDTIPGRENEISVWVTNPGKNITRYRWPGRHPPKPAETITENDGLPGHIIRAPVFDEQGRLWIATTRGISVMQRGSEGKWLHQDPGIHVTEPATAFSFTRPLLTETGKMWVNVQNKLLLFDTRKISLTPPRINTVIESIELPGRPVRWSLLADSLFSYRQVPVKPVLDHDQHTLHIVFNGLQFQTNAPLEYAYRLLPSDTVWHHTGTGHMVTLYRLDPGTYTFEVKSHTGGFAWSEAAEFSFTIRSPFWTTWWFRFLVILAAAGLIVLVFRLRIRQLKRKNNMQERLRDLETKAFKLQMNPHFIHNALNSIQSLVINNKTREAGFYISQFAKLLRQVLENSDQNLISLEKELYSLRLYTELEKLRMNTDVEYHEQVDENIISSETRIPPLILQPFVENALWHGLSHKTGIKKIDLTVTRQNNWLTCTITDNGIGRKKAAEKYASFPEGHLSKAVMIIQQRLADYNQSPGTEPVSMVDLEKDGQALGTSVIVRVKIQ